MIFANPKDFTVNLHERTATHRSGAIVEFDECLDPAQWTQQMPNRVRNPDLFEGDENSLFEAAKTAALAAGMKYRSE